MRADKAGEALPNARLNKPLTSLAVDTSHAVMLTMLLNSGWWGSVSGRLLLSLLLLSLPVLLQRVMCWTC
jgi:hypothetical protein